MQIQFTLQNKLMKVDNNCPIKSKLIYFKGTDEFIRNSEEKSFSEIRQSIQKKYQPAISQLRAKRKEAADYAKNTISNRLTKTDLGNELKPIDIVRMDRTFADKVYKEGRDYPIFKIAQRMQIHYCEATARKLYRCPNCVMFISKNKELGDSLFKELEYYIKELSLGSASPFSNNEYFGINKKTLIQGNYDKITPLEDHIQTLAAPYRLVFKTLEDSLPPNASIIERQYALFDALQAAEENYKKNKISTVLHVRDLEQMIDINNNDEQSIAIMKDLMDKSGRYFHTMITFTNTDPSKSDPGTIVSHRVGYKADLDALGIQKISSNIVISDDMKKIVDEATELYGDAYVKYNNYTEQIEALQNQCNEEIKQLEKQFPKPKTPAKSKTQIVNKKLDSDVNKPLTQTLEQSAKKLTKNQKTAIAIGVVFALATLFTVLYKKGFFNKLIHKFNFINNKINSKDKNNNTSSSSYQIKQSEIFKCFD